MEKVWVVYILECADGTLYTGITDSLERRMAAHTRGKGAKYTRGRGPFRLRYVQSCDDHAQALKRELQIKKLKRFEKLSLIKSSVNTAERIE